MQQTGFPENESRISGGSFLKIFNCSFLGQIDFVCPPWQTFIWFQLTLVKFFEMSVFVSVFESVIVFVSVFVFVSYLYLYLRGKRIQ